MRTPQVEDAHEPIRISGDVPTQHLKFRTQRRVVVQ